jgi:Domain of unknown function (DUF1707)
VGRRGDRRGVVGLTVGLPFVWARERGGSSLSTQPQAPAQLASEDVIISAPMSYVGSAQRIIRLRRRAEGERSLAAMTALAVLLIILAWAVITVWYLMWGFLLVPYRVVRRGARKRKLEALRHRELMGTIQGSAAASAAAIVAAMSGSETSSASHPPNELVADDDREATIEELREHLLAGRLSAEEFEERLAAAQRARTRADLDAVRVDLPCNSYTLPFGVAGTEPPGASHT